MLKTPLQLVNWFQRYEQLKDEKRKQKTFFALIGSILKSIFPTFDWFCLITSQLVIHRLWLIAFEPVAKLRCSAGMGGPHATGRWHQARDLQYTPCYKWISLAHLLPQFAFYVSILFTLSLCFLRKSSLFSTRNFGHFVLLLLFSCSQCAVIFITCSKCWSFGFVLAIYLSLLSLFCWSFLFSTTSWFTFALFLLYTPRVNTNLWIAMPVKSVLSNTKSSCVNINKIIKSFITIST